MATKMNIATKVILRNQLKMPIFGIGTSHNGGYSNEAIVYALRDCGYRMIDTAERYGSEGPIRLSIKESGIPREEIFITTKLRWENYGYEQALEAFEGSLDRLGTDYVDLYMLHWPGNGSDGDPRTVRADTWKALEHLYKKGKCKAIGVSNFLERHLSQLMEDCEIVPHVNQIEYNPCQNQTELLAFCRRNGIYIEGYCPLAKGEILADEHISLIAKAHNKTAAQVCIRWSLQNDVITIPKSIKVERVKENCGVFDFELTEKEMQTVNGLHRNLRVTWDPTDIM
ncbi:unnamed protein product [Owenia fusiformis]|uniref:Uncharacterized protein n=1 Tax=Owenia fusiformis TaxID=6347 RepID=A0A8J1XHR8_OWEFU|nr:unnamed protein product [Owenia fusiformis]